MKFADYYKEQNKRLIVIFPGGFHPFHLGHKSIYDNIKKTFPTADVFIVATDYTEERPLSFDEKKFIISSTGIDSNVIKKVKSPFRAEEVLSKYNPEKDIVIFAISEKEKNDADKKSLFIRKKKDGTPTYFQDFKSIEKMDPFKKHAYIYLFPVKPFKINGIDVTSASQLRQSYVFMSEQEKINLLKSLYIKNIDKIKNILDKKLISKDEENEIIKQQMLDPHNRPGSSLGYPPYNTQGSPTVGREVS